MPQYHKNPDTVSSLSPEQYRVTQRDGTERPFDNACWDNKESGIYVDVISGEPLFVSVNKFDSSSGWPTFAGMEASLVEVSYPPGGRSAEHRHPGFIVGYVLEGQIRFAINHETPRVLRKGEMFYEPTGALHSTPENAQPGMPAKIPALVAPPGRPVVEGK